MAKQEKHFYMPFEHRLWLSDPELGACSPETRGIWVDLILNMYEAGRTGKLCLTPEKMAILGRCNPPQLLRAIQELENEGAAEVTRRNGKITVINRKMYREHKEREGNRLRQERHRRNSSNNSDVTGDSNSNSKKPPISPASGGLGDDVAEGRKTMEQRTADRVLELVKGTP